MKAEYLENVKEENDERRNRFYQNNVGGEFAFD